MVNDGKVKEFLMLPGMDEVFEWPFSPFGRSLDDRLRERGAQLRAKVAELGDARLNLNRIYHFNDFTQEGITVFYERKIIYPKWILEPEHLEYADFTPEEVTWMFDGGESYPKIPISLVLEKCKDSMKGTEGIEIKMSGEIIDVRILSGKKLEIFYKSCPSKLIAYTHSLFNIDNTRINDPHVGNTSQQVPLVKDFVDNIFKIIDYQQTLQTL